MGFPAHLSEPKSIQYNKLLGLKQMYKEIDKLLEESLEKLTKAACEFRELDSSEIDTPLNDIGKAIMSIWDLRDKIFAISPELKPQNVRDFENTEKLFKAELDIATELYKSGKPSDAIKALEELAKNPNAKSLEGSITGRIAHIKLDSKPNKKNPE